MNPFINKALKPIFMAIASYGINNPHTPYEVELMVANRKPTCILNDFSLDPNQACSEEKKKVIITMNEMVSSGKIVLIGVYKTKKIGKIKVFAQSDKVEDGKELFARIYGDGKGYTALSANEEYERVGTLLGFSKNDIKLNYINSLHKYVCLKTNDYRAKIRNELTLNS